jgi:hypothetical protein
MYFSLAFVALDKHNTHMEPRTEADAGKMQKKTVSDAQRVRLPLTSTRRSAIKYLKLLESVAPSARSGFDFRGRWLRPGAEIDEREIPDPAILLEGAGSDGSGRRDSLSLYLLWRYDRRTHEWRECARSWGSSCEWVGELGPIAERLLRPMPVVCDVSSEAARLEALFDHEFAKFRPAVQAQLAGVLHDRLATRLMRTWTSAAA